MNRTTKKVIVWGGGSSVLVGLATAALMTFFTWRENTQGGFSPSYWYGYGLSQFVSVAALSFTLFGLFPALVLFQERPLRRLFIFGGIVLSYFLFSFICYDVASFRGEHSDEEGPYYRFDRMNRDQIAAYVVFKYFLNFPLGIPSWFYCDCSQNSGEDRWMRWTVWTFLPNSILMGSLGAFLFSRTFKPKRGPTTRTG